MNRLYGLVQAEGICFEAFGTVVGIRSNERLTLPDIEDRLPRGWRRRKPGPADRVYSFLFNRRTAGRRIRRFHLLYGDEQMLARSEREEDLLAEFQRDLNRYLSQGSGSWVFIHAGVVGWNGSAILIPGRSFTGKTTLVKRFLEKGATYYSDEFAALDKRGRVHPFVTSLGLRSEGGEEQAYIPPQDLGCKTGVKPMRVGLILLTRYKRGAHWQPQPLSPGRALLELLGNAFSARGEPAIAMGVLCRVVEQARVLTGVRGEAQEVVRTILTEFAEGTREVLRS